MTQLTADKPFAAVTGENTTCYATFTEAVADATGGRITDAPRDSVSAMADPAFDRRVNALSQDTGQAVAQASAVILGIEYEHGNYGGGSWIVEADSGCNPDPGLDWGFPYLGNWNDKISSFRVYGDCWVNHYEDEDYGGATTGWRGSTSYIGSAMNDETSSIIWGG
ncbi:peptidase inhibitor family I36 protein [Streptosporangium carneum]|uniref:peptidase inhibitor family I36 protein n=1 Tax=Streptosporangium carneum TaxID=47481 RepID=UPI0022F33CED|nr:peptidase inhibitor family I36 protein [Streptosporangium carneum]